MSNDFTKDLSPYEDNNNNPIRGQYHFDIPQDIEPNAYEMNIDYESHDETKQDAYQYDGWIVVGHRPYFYAEPLIVPYNTLAVSEEAITSYEKFSTSFNAIVKAFEDSALQRIVKNLPYHLRVLKGQFKDYYENPDSVARTNIVNDYNTSSQIIDVNMPQSTGSTGTGTTPLKVSNIYESNQTIQNYNTLFARCKGTRDRGTDNYVPGTLVIPLIIGTTRVYIRSLSDASLTVNKNISETGTVEPVAQVCGGGSISLIADLYYQWAMRSDTENDHMKYGYETWRTDPKKQVYVGAVKLQTNINGTWEDVPQSLIVPMNEATTILSDGSIVHTPNKIGRLQIRYTNPLPYMSQQSFKYRWTYKGKVGATFDNTSGELYFETSPDYGTETKIQSKVFRLINSRYEDSSSTMELWKGVDNHVTFYVQLKQGNTYQSSGGLAGVINYTFYGETGSVYVDSNGRTVISLPKEKKGTQIEMEYVPYSNNLQNYTTTFQIHYTPQDTELKITYPSSPNKIEITTSDFTPAMDGAIIINDSIKPKITIKGKQTQHPVTGGTLSFSLSRTYKQGDETITISEVENIHTLSPSESEALYSLDGTETEIPFTTLHRMKLRQLFDETVAAGESKYNAYTLNVNYSGNSDFLPATTRKPLGMFTYPCVDPYFEVVCDDDGHGNGLWFPNNGQNNVYEVPVGGSVNLIFIASGSELNMISDFSMDDVFISNLKTNVTFFDYDNDITLADGRVISAGQGLEIPTNSETWFAGSSATNDGYTDDNGECTWDWDLPTTETWDIPRPNCKLRCKIQSKDTIPFETTVIDIPFKITRD